MCVFVNFVCVSVCVCGWVFVSLSVGEIDIDYSAASAVNQFKALFLVLRRHCVDTLFFRLALFVNVSNA